MVPHVIHRLEAVAAHPDGKEWIVRAECVQITCTVKHAIKHVNAKRRIQRRVIHEPENVTANQDGVACYVIAHVHF